MAESEQRNLKSKRFNSLRVIERKEPQSQYWRCFCICGNTVSVSAQDLLSARVTSCGCDLAVTPRTEVRETTRAPAYFKSNTEYRFISKGTTAFKISIPKPEGGYRYKSIGFKRIGEQEALRKAIIERNKLGKEEWKKFWHKVVSDWTLLARLPRSLEPLVRSASDRKSPTLEYVANWIERDKHGNPIKKSRRYSIEKHGKLAAYTKAKSALLKAHTSNMQLLIFMGRSPVIKFK
ncbi:hypothetical protein L1D14_07390 [Vibrio tubiashii]|uniref:hypothetical protein n=1 Tax=Vibrio tubiashii TaxID=29498 RepID=UPI001EFEAD0E|nr:hypothetical protein [Vibrio tubiashii]MCG9576061.1 hypothetical protein [Vibrio tubiashii]